MHYLSGILVLPFFKTKMQGMEKKWKPEEWSTMSEWRSSVTRKAYRTHAALDIFDSEFPEYTSIPLSENCDSAKLKTELERILAVPTVRQQLAILNENSSVGNLPILNTEAGQKAQLMARRGNPAKTRPIRSGSNICPHCYIKLPPHILGDIEKNRISLCIHSTCRELITADL